MADEHFIDTGIMTAADQAAEMDHLEDEARAKKDFAELPASAATIPFKPLGPPPDFHENLTADPPREIPAVDRLRAFEDEHFGKDAVRIGGKVERGSGSPFAAMSDKEKRQYAALEKLIAAEQKVADAHAALSAAEAEHEAALAAAETE